MPYITREDGVHFVIPSYRDVLTAKNKSAVQKEVIALSQNYGEYITLQRKGPQQYEVAFSPDTGYLLGETVWHHFNRPVDMIYCEVVPNTTEAILVIVKGSSVYLDGSFPTESIPEELIIFLTQQNNFEVYIYGDVPISEKPIEGKFSFDAASLKSFTVLDQPVFKSLPLLKPYQFQLVDAVLKELGIGVFPVKQLIMVLAAVGIGWGLYSYLTATEAPQEVVQVEVNPFQAYLDLLTTPAPDQLMASFIDGMQLLYTAPGWKMINITYNAGTINAMMLSTGNSIGALLEWCKSHDLLLTIKTGGIMVSLDIKVKNRAMPKQIFPVKEVLVNFVDNISNVYPGNAITLTESKGSKDFSSLVVAIAVQGVSPMVLSLIGQQMKGLPLALDKIALVSTDQALSGTITLTALGN